MGLSMRVSTGVELVRYVRTAPSPRYPVVQVKSLFVMVVVRSGMLP